MSAYYKYAPDGFRVFVLSYVYDCVYWYTPEELGKVVCGYTWKGIQYELPRICTLVYFH